LSILLTLKVRTFKNTIDISSIATMKVMGGKLKESGYHLPRYCIILSGASIHPSRRPGARILENVPLDNTLPLKSLSFLQRKPVLL
jgi:hypothetical protein